MPSLRRRLLAGTGLGTAIILVASGSALYALVQASLLREFDTALREKAASLSALVEQSGDEIVLEFTEEDMIEFQRTQRPEYFQVWKDDGTIIGKSPLLGDANLPGASKTESEPVVLPLELPGHLRGRAVITRFRPRLDDEKPPPDRHELVTLALARDTAEVDSSLAELAALLIGVGAAATLTSLGVLAWLVGVGLRPVDRLAGEISRIDEGRLSARIDASESPQELTSIVVRLNELLQRLESAFRREKTMTANVAHELRTPLAGIRTTLEVALSRDRDAASLREVMSECLAICAQTQRLVENLLTMARIEGGKDAIASESIDVAAFLQKAWAPYEKTVRNRGLRVHWEVEQGLRVDSDPQKLHVVFTNVLENAAHYADEGGTIFIHGNRLHGKLQIRVTNTGSGLAAEDVSRVFEPFWRGDASRAATGTHCGLGLPLCKSIVELLGGAIHATTEGGEFHLSMTL